MRVGEAFMATLVERGETLERLDYCMEAWEAGARPQGLVYGVWRSRVPEKGARRQLIAGEDLMDLFEQLADAEEDSRVAFRYVLCLILIRKKLLVYEGTRDGVVLVRARGVAPPPEGPALVEVRDPGMDEARIAEVCEQLGQVIDEGEA